MGTAIAFWILAVVVVVAALGVIVQKNVFRVALALIVCLVAVAGLYVLLSADFLAAAQILIYVGAISVVIILAIMLTQQFAHGSPPNRLRLPALLVSAVLLALLVFAVLATHWNTVDAPPASPTTAVLAEKLFGGNGFILPLEISAVLILSVVIGAIVMAREK